MRHTLDWPSSSKGLAHIGTYPSDDNPKKSEENKTKVSTFYLSDGSILY
jgi:hypothetical protein